MSKIRITLTAYNMGPNATEADFDAWAAYVAEHIDEALGIDAEVDQHPFSGGPADDTIRGADEVKEEEIIGYLGVYGWDEFCSSLAPTGNDAGAANLRREHV